VHLGAAAADVQAADEFDLADELLDLGQLHEGLLEKRGSSGSRS
jgi:hypothetical protein